MSGSIDIVIPWPSNCDYPLWRQFITEEGWRFGRVIVVFTQAGTGYDYRPDVTKVLGMIGPNILVTDSPKVMPDEDWRDVATRYGLKFVISEWVWFTEQDFLPKLGFFDHILEYYNMATDVIAAYQGDRMHPCSIFIAKATLDKMRLDFGIKPNVADHFSKIQDQIESLKLIVGKIDEHLYYHFNGLSHNFRLVSEGQLPNYQPKEFLEYLKTSISAQVPQIAEYQNTAKKGILLMQSAQ
jgi:hypothetical protein